MTTATLTPVQERQAIESQSADDFCRSLLPKVSRTFAVCIELLPKKLANAVRVAYLICRIADTIEDRPDLPADDKAQWLDQLAESLSLSLEQAIAILHEALTAFSEPRNDDEWLTRETPRVLQAFFDLDLASQHAIRPWVEEMCRGMRWFAAAYPEPTPGDLAALKDIPAIDRYCFFVAGTVGHLLTDLFRCHLKRLRPGHYQQLKGLATSFGLGLQLTNIIKDVADDHQRGWCFVPRSLCEKHGITAEQLLSADHADAAQAVMNELIGKAAQHLEDAKRYCLALPRSAWKVRVFCLTPLLFAIATLRRASQDPRLLDPSHKSQNHAS